MWKEKFEEVFMKWKLIFRKVLLDSQANDEGQLRSGMTAYVMVRTADSPHIGIVEISYAKVWAMIDISTKGRTHREDPADKEIMPDLPRDYMRNTVYTDC